MSQKLFLRDSRFKLVRPSELLDEDLIDMESSLYNFQWKLRLLQREAAQQADNEYSIYVDARSVLTPYISLLDNFFTQDVLLGPTYTRVGDFTDPLLVKKAAQYFNTSEAIICEIEMLSASVILFNRSSHSFFKEVAEFYDNYIAHYNPPPNRKFRWDQSVLSIFYHFRYGTTVPPFDNQAVTWWMYDLKRQTVQSGCNRISLFDRDRAIENHKKNAVSFPAVIIYRNASLFRTLSGLIYNFYRNRK